MARSSVLIGAVLLLCGAFITAFVLAFHSCHAFAFAGSTGTAAALTAAPLLTPQAAFADGLGLHPCTGRANWILPQFCMEHSVAPRTGYGCTDEFQNN